MVLERWNEKNLILCFTGFDINCKIFSVLERFFLVKILLHLEPLWQIEKFYYASFKVRQIEDTWIELSFLYRKLLIRSKKQIEVRIIIEWRIYRDLFTFIILDYWFWMDWIGLLEDSKGLK